jgi:hypothetical protein
VIQSTGGFYYTKNRLLAEIVFSLNLAYLQGNRRKWWKPRD